LSHLTKWAAKAALTDGKHWTFGALMVVFWRHNLRGKFAFSIAKAGHGENDEILDFSSFDRWVRRRVAPVHQRL
jgi:hypothetical protein